MSHKRDELDTAESLIDWLDVSNWGDDPRDWAFRGHDDSSYVLLPTALRPGTHLLTASGWTKGPLSTAGEQCAAEYALLRRFYRLSDVQGLPIPGDTPAIRRAFRSHSLQVDDFSTQSWPPSELHWVLAAAQHYGVPTRLLDWSRKPLLAAWFAAVGAAQKWADCEPAKRAAIADKALEVWALDRQQSSAISAMQHVEAPRSMVPNLHLQSGVFTVVSTEKKDFPNQLEDDPATTTLDNLLSKSTAPLLRSATLPWSQAGKLLTMLRDRFVQAATVYHGYRGVAQSVLEHRYRAPK